MTSVSLDPLDQNTAIGGNLINKNSAETSALIAKNNVNQTKSHLLNY